MTLGRAGQSVTAILEGLSESFEAPASLRVHAVFTRTHDARTGSIVGARHDHADLSCAQRLAGLF